MFGKPERAYDRIIEQGLYIREDMDCYTEWTEGLSVAKRRVLGSTDLHGKSLDEWADEFNCTVSELIQLLNKAVPKGEREEVRQEFESKLEENLKHYYGIEEPELEPEPVTVPEPEPEPEPEPVPYWKRLWKRLRPYFKPTYKRRKLWKRFKSHFKWEPPLILKHLFYSRYKMVPLYIGVMLLLSISLNVAMFIPTPVGGPLTLDDFPGVILGGLIGRTVKVWTPIYSVNVWRASPAQKAIVFMNSEPAQFGKDQRFELVSLYREKDWIEYCRDLVGKYVLVKGQLQTYKGTPQIQLQAPSQILKIRDNPPSKYRFSGAEKSFMEQMRKIKESENNEKN